MATAVKRTTRARPEAHDTVAEINAALLQLLEAIPVDHLDRRVSALEHWAARVQKDMERLMTDLGRPITPRARPAAVTVTRRTRTARARRVVAPVRSRIAHLPVESELAHPGG